ncbi:MAG TPA: T9SS type A sorting domain-containing protein [Bacteroidales bacterium]
MKNTFSNIILFSFFILHLPVISFSQNVEIPWESCFGGSEFEYCIDVILSNNNYYVLSKTESNNGDVTYNHGLTDLWLIKTDLDGNLLFEKCIGGSKGEGASNLLKISDSTFYIAGSTKSNDGDISYNPDTSSFNFWITKIDTLGNIIWDKVVGGSRHELTRDAIVTNDGGILMMGLTHSDDGDISNYFGFYDVWMIKLNGQGENQWDFTLGGTGLEEAASVIQTSDGGYMISASTDGSGGGNYDTTCNYHDLPHGFQDVWIVKLDSLRNIEWQQCYGGLYHDGPGDTHELNDGYIVVGNTTSNDGDVSGYHGYPGYENTEFDIWVFKIDFSGNLIWQKCLGGYYGDFSRNIFLTSDGGFMVVGRTTSNDGDVVGFHGEGTGLYGDIWLAKLSADGELQWQYCYGGNGDERIYHGVIQKGDYNYVMAIETDTDPWQCGGIMYFDIRLFEIDDTVTSISENGNGNFINNLIVTPNPATDLLKIIFSGQIGGDELVLYNTSGQEVKQIDVQSARREYELDISGLPSGLYVVVLFDGGKVVDKQKVVINH